MELSIVCMQCDVNRYFALIAVGPIAHRVYQYFQEGSEDSVALQYWDGIAVSLQGCANALVWLTHPPVFKAIRHGIIAKLCGNRAEQLPLLHAVAENLEDSQGDIQVIDRMLRRRIIESVLQGIRQSVSGDHHITGKEVGG